MQIQFFVNGLKIMTVLESNSFQRKVALLTTHISLVFPKMKNNFANFIRVKNRMKRAANRRHFLIIPTRENIKK